MKLYRHVFVMQRQTFRFFYFTSLQLVECRVAAVKRLPVLHHSADYIFISFGIIEPILVALKFKHRLSRCSVMGRIQPRKTHSCIWKGVIKPSLITKHMTEICLCGVYIFMRMGLVWKYKQSLTSLLNFLWEQYTWWWRWTVYLRYTYCAFICLFLEVWKSWKN